MFCHADDPESSTDQQPTCLKSRNHIPLNSTTKIFNHYSKHNQNPSTKMQCSPHTQKKLAFLHLQKYKKNTAYCILPFFKQINVCIKTSLFKQRPSRSLSGHQCDSIASIVNSMKRQKSKRKQLTAFLWKKNKTATIKLHTCKLNSILL